MHNLIYQYYLQLLTFYLTAQINRPTSAPFGVPSKSRCSSSCVSLVSEALSQPGYSSLSHIKCLPFGTGLSKDLCGIHLLYPFLSPEAISDFYGQLGHMLTDHHPSRAFTVQSCHSFLSFLHGACLSVCHSAFLWHSHYGKLVC